MKASLIKRRRLYDIYFQQVLSPCSRYVTVCSKSGRLVVFDILAALKPSDPIRSSVRQWNAHDGPIYSIVGFDDYLISASVGEICAWANDGVAETNSLRYKWRIALKNKVDINCIITLPEDKICAACSDATLQIFDISNGQLISSLVGHEKAILWAAKKGHNGVVTASEDGSARIWDVRMKNVTGVIKQSDNSSWKSAIAVDSSEQWMVLGGDDDLALWHLPSLSKTSMLDCQGASTNWVEFEDEILSAHSDGKVRRFSADGLSLSSDSLDDSGDDAITFDNDACSIISHLSDFSLLNNEWENESFCDLTNYFKSPKRQKPVKLDIYFNLKRTTNRSDFNQQFDSDDDEIDDYVLNQAEAISPTNISVMQKGPRVIVKHKRSHHQKKKDNFQKFSKLCSERFAYE